MSVKFVLLRECSLVGCNFILKYESPSHTVFLTKIKGGSMVRFSFVAGVVALAIASPAIAQQVVGTVTVPSPTALV